MAAGRVRSRRWLHTRTRARRVTDVCAVEVRAPDWRPHSAASFRALGSLAVGRIRSTTRNSKGAGSRLSPMLPRWVRCAVRQVAVRDLAQLYRRPAGDDRLAGPRHRLVHVSGFDYRKTPNVLLGFQIRAVGDEHFAIRLCPQRLRLAGCAEAASEDPGTRSFQFVVEHVDIAYRRR